MWYRVVGGARVVEAAFDGVQGDPVMGRRPQWLRDYLEGQLGSAHAAALRLEAFTAWLGATEPLAVVPADLVDLFGFWHSAIGLVRTRTAIEAVRDLYAWLESTGAPGATHRWALANDYLLHRMPQPGEETAPEPRRTIRLRGGVADVLAGCGLALVGVAFVIGGWSISAPATIIDGMGFQPVLPLVLALALASGFVLWGYVLALKAVRALGEVSVRTGWIVIAGLGGMSLVFCVIGVSGALDMLGIGAPQFALPFAAFAVAGTVGAYTVAQAILGAVRAGSPTT